MFEILDKEKPDTENIRDLNSAVIRHMIAEVSNGQLAARGLIYSSPRQV
jgi:hypothetical protein